MTALLRRAGRALRRWQQGGRRDSAATVNRSRPLLGYFCPNPFTQLDVYEGGRAYSCCSSWLPTSIGNVGKRPLLEVWNSDTSQAIRRSILDGSFRYCDARICPRIQADDLPSLEEARANEAWRKKIIDGQQVVIEDAPVVINLCNDSSCNLYCPSCRTQRTLHTRGREYETRQHLQDLITAQLFSRPSARHFRVNITGSGDPFASAVFRKFLFTLNGADFPNLRIHLQTNGVLLTPSNWRKMQRIHRNIAVVLISFDAASEATYAVTRPGGHWTTLLDNVRRLGELRRQGELQHLRLDFVVQQPNFREMPAFVALARSLGADRAAFSMVLDWGTWSPREYAAMCVWKQDHPQFQELLTVLRDPIFDEPIVDLGNLSACRALALQEAG